MELLLEYPRSRGLSSHLLFNMLDVIRSLIGARFLKRSGSAPATEKWPETASISGRRSVAAHAAVATPVCFRASRSA
jgi:hypothetical protein